jgi:hypothetical protein
MRPATSGIVPGKRIIENVNNLNVGISVALGLTHAQRHSGSGVTCIRFPLNRSIKSGIWKISMCM